MKAVRRDFYIDELYRLRQRKGMTRKEAETQIGNRNMFAAMMVRAGDADVVIAGLTQHYSDTIRPALEVIPLRSGFRKVSGVYLMITQKGDVYFFTDATVNIEPDSDYPSEI